VWWFVEDLHEPEIRRLRSVLNYNKKVIDRKLIAMNFFLQKFNYLNFPLEMHKTEYLAEDSLMNLT